MDSAASIGRASSVFVLGVAALGVARTSARATVSVSPLYSSNMVVQRDQPFPVRGIAATNKLITVIYNGLTNSTTSDALGNWQVTLPAMSVNPIGSNFTMVTSGPILRDVGATSNKVICSFDYVGNGLMVGYKTPYQPTRETNAPLALFSIAGPDGKWTS